MMRHHIRGITLATAAMLLAACATQPPPLLRWAKPGATYDDFLKDRYSCLRDARGERSHGRFDRRGGAIDSATVVDADMYKACMIAQGYRLDANGFAPPAGNVVPLR